DLIREHNRKYWIDGAPEISDPEYDLLIRELEARAPEHPLLQEIQAPQVAASREIALTAPMLSLDKVYSLEELLAWAKEHARTPQERFLVEPKYDGISCRYDGRILLTRGKNGATGEDITDKLPLIHLETTGYSGAVDRPARGEILIRPEDFEALRGTIRSRSNTTYRNTRNVLTGLMMLKESTMIEQVALGMKIAGAHLTLVDYALHSFPLTLEELEDRWEETVTEIRALGYPIDGIVVKIADPLYRQSLGSTAHHPRGEMAFKFTNARALTRLFGVEWSFGKNCLTPVAQLEPVELGGTTIRRASLHNLQNILDLDIQIGDEVTVERAGDVIPHITESTPGAARRSAVITHCPGCGAELRQNGPELCCVNPDCFETRLCRLTAAAEKLEVENLGESTIRAMMEQLGVRTLRDIFQLTRNDFLRLDRFAGKSADNLLSALKTARRCDDFRLLAALNIPNVGVNIAKLLLAQHSFAELRTMKADALAAIKGIGPERGSALEREFAAQKDFIDELLQAVTLVATPAAGDGLPKVCFTGKMPEKRSFYADCAAQHQLQAVDTVTADLTLLVAADPAEQSTKLERARKLGVEIIAVEEFLRRYPPSAAQTPPPEDDGGVQQLELF
ncbi:MAG: hypothetical protein J6R85_06680, partial [Lentisphaeria bacterium]|nr:hypothetical protein [Lentisphaeria bacterium]